jgi:hypothetical protein
MSFTKMIYYGLLGICLAALLLNARRLNKMYYWFIPLIIFAITVQVFEEVLKHNQIHGHSFVFHIYQPVEYSLLALFYYSVLQNHFVKKMVLLSVLFVLAFSIFYYSYGNGVFFGGDFSDFCVSAFLICIWVVVFFFELIRSDENFKLANYPAFWINAANLLFYGGCLLVMGAYYYLNSTNPVLANQLLKINHFLNLVLYCMYFIAFIQPLSWKK